MSYDSLLIDVCDLVQITETKWNKRNETTESGVKCRFTWRRKIVRDLNGEQAVSAGKVFFKTTATIKADTKIIFDERRFAVLQIRKPADSGSRHHIEVDIA